VNYARTHVVFVSTSLVRDTLKLQLQHLVRDTLKLQLMCLAALPVVKFYMAKDRKELRFKKGIAVSVTERHLSAILIVD
jgi:hypothetical protein